MKAPPRQYTDTEARDLTEKFIQKYALKGKAKSRAAKPKAKK
jgi:hypothetical protein